MKRIKRNSRGRKKSKDFSKLSLFQKFGTKSGKQCPLSGKNAPDVNYKNIIKYIDWILIKYWVISVDID